MSKNEFHISIGSMPNAGQQIEDYLRHDATLIKAALLYSDRVKLCSPNSWIYSILLSGQKFNQAQQTRLVDLLLPTIAKGDPAKQQELEEVMKLFKMLHTGRPLPGTLARHRAGVDKTFSATWKDVERQIVQFSQNLSISQMKKAFDSGVLQVQMLGPHRDAVELLAELLRQHSIAPGRTDPAYIEQLTLDYLGVLRQIVEGSSTYPFFDYSVGRFVETGMEAGIFEISGQQQERAKHIGLAADFIERLPLFDKASVDEILDIRRELQKPLKKFRAAVMGLSKQMKSDAWSQDFIMEAEDVFRTEIEAVVEEIEGEVQSNKYLLELWNKVTTTEALIPAGGSAIGLATSLVAQLPYVAATSISIGVGSALLATTAAREWHNKQKLLERHQLYFYYRAGTKLRQL